MSNIICNKCGATGNSKCPCCRSIFPDDQMDAVLSMIFKHTIKQEGNGIWCEVKYLVGVPSKDTVADIDLLKSLKGLQTNLKMIIDNPQYLCDHVWELAVGEVNEMHGGPKYKRKGKAAAGKGK